MEARFAGSQRVGDRRRRRLAAGADDNADNPNADNPARPDELSAPAGSFRAVESAHTGGLQTETSTSPHLPVALVIPADGWKYLAGGLLGLAFSAAIVIAGCFTPELQTLAGPGISGLFALPNGRVAQWFSSLLLLLCAQLALLIWWTRSRSLEDFEGRYWLWIRTAGVWLVFSGCVSIDAHNAALDTLLNIRPGLSREWATLCWMIPAAAVGVLLVGALVVEMRGCRASRVLLLLACACQLSTAGLHLEFESVFSPALRAVLVQVGLLTGHVALFVSMWLHARHVLYYTADPAPLSTRTWRVPRPHFRLPHFRLSHFRLEPSQHAASADGAPVQTDAGGREERRIEHSPIALGSRNTGPAESDAPASEAVAEMATCRDEPADSEDVSEEGASKPELRGLSKKQRRRLMQELRDRERDSGR